MRLTKVQMPDVPPFSIHPQFRWSNSERIHFYLADATAFFIYWRVVRRVRIRDRRDRLEVCAANAVFQRSMRGSKTLDASWNHLGSFLPTFHEIKGAVALIASVSLVWVEVQESVMVDCWLMYAVTFSQNSVEVSCDWSLARLRWRSGGGGGRFASFSCIRNLHLSARRSESTMLSVTPGYVMVQSLSLFVF